MNKRELRAFVIITTNKDYIIFAYCIEPAKKRLKSLKGISVCLIKEIEDDEIYDLDY